jgi:pyrroline-5-carboxylate reductase
VRATFAGTGELLASSALSPEQLRHEVASPGGTTAAGLRMLEQRAVRAAFLEAVASAAERSRQLGR